MAQDRPAVGLGVFVWKDGKFLLGKRLGPHGTGTWSVPGGYLEHGESFEDCARREVREETGLEIADIEFVTVTNNVFKSEDTHSITIWMKSTWQSGTEVVREPDKMAEFVWHDFQTLPSPLFEPCWQNLRQIRPDLFA